MVSLIFVSSSICIWTEKVFREYGMRTVTWDENGCGFSTVLVIAGRAPGGEIAILSTHGNATTAGKVSSPTKRSPLQMHSMPRADLMGLGWVRILLFKGSPTVLPCLRRQAQNSWVGVKQDLLRLSAPACLVWGKRSLHTFNFCKSTRTISYVYAFTSFKLF